MSSRPILTGVCVGFFVAIFLSMYAEYLFPNKLPLVLIYGVIAPFLAALTILILIIVDKNERKRSGLDGWDGGKKDNE